MQYHPLTLAFIRDQVHLEPMFRRAYALDALTRTRVALMVGIFLYGIFGILDALLVPDLSRTFWFIRYAIVIPSALCVLAASFHRAFERWHPPLLAGVCLVGGLGIEAMVVLAPPPVTYSYYAGIILVFIVIHTFFRMGFLWATGATWTIVIVYEIITLWVVDTPFHIFINNNFFFISSAFLCTLAGYAIELNARQRFFTSHMLVLEKEKVSAANADLDRQVKERTRELHKAYNRLNKEMQERLASQAQQMELEIALNNRQKTEALGTLAGGIAHDFNNILAAIIGYTELIKEETLEKETGRYADQVLTAAVRARELTAQILTFSRQAEEKAEPIQLPPVIREAVKLIRASVPANIDILTRVASTAWIHCDPTQIHRVIVNLCTNAVQAMADGTGTLEIRVTDPGRHRTGEEDPPGGWVEIAIKDTGHGIPPHIRDKVFDPFFTTREKDKGTGMGLAVVQGIITRAKGKILVESTPGIGTTVTLLLPVTTPPDVIVGDTAPNRESSDIRGNGEHIVVVDDELPLVQIHEKTLAGLGYRVSAFSDPGRALAALDTPKTSVAMPPDLVITDFSMPGMTGLELAGRLRTLHPQLPILMLTGYSESVTREKMAEAGITGLMIKPVNRETLGERIRQILESDGRK
ncbi:MAG: ATP-binding protein [Desulfobacterales bacterium]|nr:ATP-binding protein [Desulfobacterales bacterium]